MNIGNLDRRVIIESDGGTQNAYGEVPDSWSTHATVWASINFRGGREDYQAEQLASENRVVFIIRYLSTVTPSMRINYDSEYYYIEYIGQLTKQRKRYLELVTHKKDTDGK